MRIVAASAAFAMLVLMRVPMFAQAGVGDKVFWVPKSAANTSAASQIKRNSKYVSVRLASAYAYYKSGFFENIKSVVVSSGITIDKGQELQMINASRMKSPKDGDFIGIGDHLLVFAPASPQSIRITVSFGGVGEDKFKSIFDLLSGSELKVPLSLTASSLAQLNATTNVVRRFMSTPYTSKTPADMLNVSTSFAVYSDVSVDHADALREGYIVIVSAREKRGDDFNELLARLAADPSALRVSQDGVVTFTTAAGAQKSLLQNSYAVLSVESTPLKGEDEDSPWYAKYKAAEAECKTIVTVGKSPVDAGSTARRIWGEGNTLLDADRSYLDAEREGISATHYERLEATLAKLSVAAGKPAPPPALNAMPNSKDIAASYQKQLAQNSADVVVVTGAIGNAAEVVAHSESEEGITVTAIEQDGKFVFKGLKPGVYTVEQKTPGASSAVSSISVRPNEMKTVTIKGGGGGN
jgi:hypothetical protein